VQERQTGPSGKEAALDTRGPRPRRAGCLEDHGVEVPGGVQLTPGWADVEVGYLELLLARRLRGAVARAVQLGGQHELKGC
jgi:hypothetical protein